MAGHTENLSNWLDSVLNECNYLKTISMKTEDGGVSELDPFSLQNLMQYVQKGENSKHIRVSGPEMLKLRKAQERLVSHFDALDNMITDVQKKLESDDTKRAERILEACDRKLVYLEILKQHLEYTIQNIKAQAARRNEVLQLGEHRLKGIDDPKNVTKIAPGIQMLMNAFVKYYDKNIPGDNIEEQFTQFILDQSKKSLDRSIMIKAFDLVLVLGGKDKFSKEFKVLLKDPVIKERLQKAEVQIERRRIEFNSSERKPR